MGRWGARERRADEGEAPGAGLRGPPSELREATCEAPPVGYIAHKGCLLPQPFVAEGRWDLGCAPDAAVAAQAPGAVGDDRPAPGPAPAPPFAARRAARWGAGVATGATDGPDPDAGEERSRRARQRSERRLRARAERRGAVSADAARRAVLWLRDDLRLDDNPALCEGAQFESLVCVFVHDTDDPSPWPLRGAAKWYKYESLKQFRAALRAAGGDLFVRAGPAADVLLQVCLEVDAEVVLWNRLCEPWYRERDLAVARACELNGIEARTFKAAALWEPWEARPDERSYSRGFGSVGFYRSAVEELGDVPEPLEAVARLPGPPSDRQELVSGSLDLEALGYHFTAGRGFPQDLRDHNEKRQRRAEGGLAPQDDWAAEMRAFWRAGEAAAQARLREFLDDVMAEGTYEGRERFRADRRWTAILSPYIRFGELSVRRCYHESQRFARQKVSTEKGPRPVNSTFARRFFWRDLAYWCLWRFPDMPTKSIREHYEREAWAGTDLQLRRWQRGRTGFPLVDAGMRQLWKVGWMPNYLRHICAQFLIEYLDISWKSGFEWFDYTLVDSDVAINAFMWQNGGHSGLDQWNFVMHPIFAAKTCDPDGDYVRRWLPELRHLPPEYIHCPWEAPQRLLIGANIILGRTYHEQIIEDLDQARVKHTRNVLAVRRDNKGLIAKGGNEWFEARPGQWVTLITREDFRQDTEALVTRQTADDPRHAKRRQLQDPLSLVIGDCARQHDTAQAAAERDIL